MAGPSSVLLVDDEAHIRLYLKALLKRLGVETFYEASDGEPAIALYEQEKPDLVLLDVNMPGMDGLEVLERITAKDPDAVVIMLTAQASRKVVERSSEGGARQYIRKDSLKEEMIKILEETFADIWGD